MLLDGPTWLSMVHELWEQDAALGNTACTQETLCRMNRLAMAAPGQAGWAVSLSRLDTVCILFIFFLFSVFVISILFYLVCL